jgi:FkbM family methyltransferase
MNLSAIPRDTLLGRLVRWPLRLIPEGSQVRILQGPLRGKRWIAGSSTHGCWFGSYELPKQKAFSQALKPGDVVYDLGANVGFYSLLASVLVGPQGKVCSFEPAPRNLLILRKHLALNGITNCKIYEAAVSDSRGFAKFDPSGDWSQGHLTAVTTNSFTVPTISLDDLVSSGELPPPQVIKCDIEGAEYAALQGALKLLKAAAPIIFLATHGPEIHEQCCQLLTTLHYSLRSLDDSPLASTTEILAVPQSKHL